MIAAFLRNSVAAFVFLGLTYLWHLSRKAYKFSLKQAKFSLA
jgi:hypothetical protein